MGADPQELVADVPGKERRRGIAARVVQAAEARRPKVRVLVGRMQEHVGVEDEHLLFFHRPVERIAVRDVDQRAAAVPGR